MPTLTKIISHLATWGVLFLLPMVFRTLDFPEQMLHVAGVVTLFYLNYLWLTPRYYMRGHKLLCWIVNSALLAAIIGVMYFRRGVVELSYLFNLSVAVMISVSMRLGSIWQESVEAQLKAETARAEAEAARAEAELHNLQYQTNPHFLLNTLNNIYALTAFDAKRAQEAIEQLSAMLHHILYDNQEDEVKLTDEVDFLQNYINLMKIRQSGKLDITFDVDVRCDGVKIVPLILIPLVENAFKHGISPTQPNFIHIRLYADCEQIDFSIDNSNHPKTGNDCSGHGIGLTQVTKRLEIAYAGRYAWQHGPSDDNAAYCSHINIKLAKA
jgi:LytS/YehU family sensor histidine kinase